MHRQRTVVYSLLVRRLARFPLSSALFWVLVAVYAGYAFTLPLFVSGDGPGHVWWGGVLADSLTGGGTYPDFVLGHVLPPYALGEYYLAGALGLVSGAMAEKILVAACVVVFCGGVWWLARVVAGGPTWAPLLVVPFAFHRHLFAGFYNFTLGAGLAVWLAAFWLVSYRRLRGWRIAGFFGFVFVLYLAHPFGLAMGLLFCGLHVQMSMLRTAAKTEGDAGQRVLVSLREHRNGLLCLAGAAIPAWYVTTFVGGQTTPTADVSLGNLREGALAFWRMEGLLAHAAETAWVVRVILAGIAIALAVAGAVWPRNKQESGDARFVFFFAGLLFVVYSWAPESMGPAIMIAQRFAVFLIAFLVASAAGARLPRQAPAALSIVVFVLALVSFRAEVRVHRRSVEMNRIMVEAPPLKPGATGAVFVEGSWARASCPGVGYWLCVWSAGHYFQRSRATMLNAPWIYVPYSIMQLREYRPYWGKDSPMMYDYLKRAMEAPEKAPLPEHLDLLIGADCSNKAPDHQLLRQVAERYGLVLMPWSTRAYQFYSRPELVAEYPGPR